jgi:hypothetical protein
MNEPEFVSGVLSNPINAAILARFDELALPDCWLVSGAVFQTVWNKLTGRAPTHGIRDYDIFYFDPVTSWDAEDFAIKHAAQLFAGIDASIEVRNQARVHLWYPEKFGAPYPPATRATDGIDRFLMHCAQVGVARRGTSYAVYAPHGLDDVETLTIRPNKTGNFRADRYLEKAWRWKSVWPELTIVPAENGGTP